MRARFWHLTAALLGTAFLFFGMRPLAAPVRAAGPTPTATTVPTTGASSKPAAENAVLCFPGIYPQNYATNCEPWGPSAYLTSMASQGYLYPPLPLPARPLPKTWNTLPGKWQYAQVRKDGQRALYPSLEDADSGTKPRHFPPGFIYVSYTKTAFYNHHTYYLVDPRGWWMQKNDLWGVAPSRFHGVLLESTPPRPFGWILQNIATKRSPGYGSRDKTRHQLHRYEIVQIYATAQANGIDWYMIAPDEWVPQTMVGVVFPRRLPPKGVEGQRWIEVNLFEQTLAVYDHGHMIFATLVSTGEPPFWTVPGLFQIYKKLPTTQMRGAFEADRSDYYQLEDVPWTMYYDHTRALHGAYWHDYFGYKTSHGCINLTIADSHWLYEWAHLGDWVYVYDPSGKTPLEGGGGGP